MKQPLEITTRHIISFLRPRLFIISISKIKNDDNVIQPYFQAVR